MNFKKYLPFVIVICFLIIFSVFLSKQNNFSGKIIDNNIKYTKIDENKIKYVKIGGVLVKVELAITSEEHEQGLSGRISMKDDEGMLFIFSEPQINYFWMKEMKFPIDIVWIDENSQIIFIEKSVQPESYPNSFGPEQKSQYVLEIPAGFSEKNNLQVNDQVEFLP